MKKSVIFILLVCLFIGVFVGCSNENVDSEKTAKKISLSESDFIDKNYLDVWNLLDENGFTNVGALPLDDLTSKEKNKDGTVENVLFDGVEEYEAGVTYMSDIEIIIYYHNIKTVYAPFTSEEIPQDETYEEIKEQFEDCGFKNIKCEPIEDLLLGWLTEDGSVESIMIDGRETYDDITSFAFDTEVIIKYHTFPSSSISGEESTTSHEKQINDSNLTIDNCTELKDLLTNKKEDYQKYQSFANKYSGQIIEFDGSVVNVMLHGEYKTRYDILVSAGDFSEISQIGPSFKFEDVNYSNLGLSFDDMYLENLFSDNIHIIAEVKNFDINTGLFYLDPVLITKR